MRGSVVVVGMGQLGRLLGGGLLATGRTVIPVRRGDDARAVIEGAAPELVLVGVGEDDLAPVLAAIPDGFRDRVALLQNELSPADWRAHAIASPTVAVVWCEKKAKKPLAIVRETELFGPHAALLAKALDAVDVPSIVLGSEQALDEALVVKNLYILVSNFAGLAGAQKVGELLGDRRELARALAGDVLAVEEARLGRAVPREALLDRMDAAFAADPAHGCKGRTSAARLSRTLRRARVLGVAVPELEKLAASAG